MVGARSLSIAAALVLGFAFSAGEAADALGRQSPDVVRASGTIRLVTKGQSKRTLDGVTTSQTWDIDVTWHVTRTDPAQRDASSEYYRHLLGYVTGHINIAQDVVDHKGPGVSCSEHFARDWSGKVTVNSGSQAAHEEVDADYRGVWNELLFTFGVSGATSTSPTNNACYMPFVAPYNKDISAGVRFDEKDFRPAYEHSTREINDWDFALSPVVATAVTGPAKLITNLHLTPLSNATA